MCYNLSVKKKGVKAMKVYTEEELKKWFDCMEKKYRNCGSYQCLRMVRMSMFDDFCKSDNLTTVLGKEEEND